MEDFKSRRLEDYPNQQRHDEEIKIQNQIKALEEMTKKHLSKEAIMRFSNIKAANPELCLKIITIIPQLAQNGYITEKLDDNKFKSLLKQLQEDKQFKIQRK